MNEPIRASSAIAVGALLSACSMGTPSLPPVQSSSYLSQTMRSPAPAVVAPATGATGTATFSIKVPQTSRNVVVDATHPRYVSPNTHSLRVSLIAIDGKTSHASDVVAAVAYGSPGCTAKRSQPLVCTASMTVPAAQYDTFTISTYASTTGSGKVLAKATVTKAIRSGVTRAIAFTLGGVVASIELSPSTIHTVQNGSTVSFLVSLTPLDASGAVIVGKKPFQSPISIDVRDDPEHALLVSQAIVAKPGLPFEIWYNGSKTLADGKIVASAGTMGRAKTDVIPLSYSPSQLTMPMGGKAKKILVSEVGFTGTFTTKIDDPKIATSTVQSTGSGKATISLKPASLGGSSGPATLTIGDGKRSGTVAVNVTAPVLPGIEYHPMSSSEFSPFFATTLKGKVYMTSGNDILEFNPSNLKLDAYPILPSGYGQSAGITSDTAGNLWFAYNAYPAEICEMKLPAHAATCYQDGMQTDSNVYGVARGSDGAIWFADPTYNNTPAIGRIDPTTYVITEYTTGMMTGASPYGIVGGIDGNVYFSDVNSDRPAFGAVNATTGAIKEYTRGLQPYNPKTAKQSSPYHIALAPNGDVWGADGGEAAMDHFYVAQHKTVALKNGIQRYGNPSELAFTTKGELWFLDTGLFDQFLTGKVDVSTGAIQEYGGFPIGPSGASISSVGLVSTSPHDLWFASGYAGFGAAMAHIPI